MKRILTIFISCFIIAFKLSAQTVPYIETENGKKLDAAQILNTGSSGNEFIICFPPNELYSQASGGTEYQDIYVTSPFDTDVRWKSNAGSGSGTVAIKAYTITTIKRNQMDEIREFEKPVNKTFTLTSEKRFSVYVMNRKVTTSDGYLALPTSSWGNHYFHLASKDNPEGEKKISKGSGFAIMAKNDNTEVKIKLIDQYNFKKNPPFGLGRTTGEGTQGSPTYNTEMKGGDSVVIRLNRGNVYVIQGDGLTQDFDLSGSRITSDKPIGVISYHMRTDMPANSNSSRNHLVEMIPPVTAWANKYVTREFDRGNKGKGDLIRVLAAEDSTQLVIKCYELKPPHSLLYSKTVNLSKSEVFTYNDIKQNGSTYGIKGATIIESNKKILAHQYSYDASWDNNYSFDPFMISLSSVDQFVPLTIFQTPREFEDNYFNFITLGYMAGDESKSPWNTVNPATNKNWTPEEINTAKLNSLYIGRDDTSMTKITLSDSNRIPSSDYYITTNGDTIGGYYWGSVKTTEGLWRFESNDFLTKFGGYIYGFDGADGYGWPAAGAYRDLNQIDTIAPLKVLKERVDNIKWNCAYTDSLDLRDANLKGQKDLGLSLITLVNNYNPNDKKSWSYNVTLIDSNNIKCMSICANYKDYLFGISVVDSTKPARALVKIMDQNYNVSTDTVYYTPSINNVGENSELFTVSPNPANDIIYLNISDNRFNGDYNLSLYNSLGVKVKDLANGEISGELSLQIKTDDLTSGVYFIKLQVGTLSESKQIIINR